MNVDGIEVQDPTLVVIRRKGANYEARKVQARADVMSELVPVLERSLVLAASTNNRPYSPDDEALDADHVVVNGEDLLDDKLIACLDDEGDLPNLELAAQAAEHDVPQDFALQEENLALDRVWQNSMFCYAFITGHGENRTVFLKKSNPIAYLSRGIIRAALSTNGLDRIRFPILAFESSIDVIQRGNDIVALSKKGFEQLFHSQEVVKSMVGPWMETALVQLPITEGSFDAFIERMGRTATGRKLAMSIARKPNIHLLTIERFQQIAASFNRNLDNVVVDGTLNLIPENDELIIDVLNSRLKLDEISGELQRIGSRTNVL